MMTNMTIIAERLDTIPALSKGRHRSINAGACLLEAVSYVAGEPWSDHPSCASPILGVFGRSLNDVLPDGKRQRLVPLVPRIVGTAGDGRDQERGLMAADWLIRVYTPAWFRLAGLEEAAVSLETLPSQASWDDVQAAVPVVREVHSEAVTARDAAWASAGATAWAAAGAAARAAARAAAWASAGVAAGDVSRATAGATAGDLARAAALAAARAVAFDANRAASWEALRPTVDLLLDSAIDLFTRMVEVGR